MSHEHVKIWACRGYNIQQTQLDGNAGMLNVIWKHVKASTNTPPLTKALPAKVANN